MAPTEASYPKSQDTFKTEAPKEAAGGWDNQDADKGGEPAD